MPLRPPRDQHHVVAEQRRACGPARLPACAVVAVQVLVPLNSSADASVAAAAVAARDQHLPVRDDRSPAAPSPCGPSAPPSSSRRSTRSRARSPGRKIAVAQRRRAVLAARDQDLAVRPAWSRCAARARARDRRQRRERRLRRIEQIDRRQRRAAAVAADQQHLVVELRLVRLEQRRRVGLQAGRRDRAGRRRPAARARRRVVDRRALSASWCRSGRRRPAPCRRRAASRCARGARRSGCRPSTQVPAVGS